MKQLEEDLYDGQVLQKLLGESRASPAKGHSILCKGARAARPQGSLGAAALSPRSRWWLLVAAGHAQVPELSRGAREKGQEWCHFLCRPALLQGWWGGNGLMQFSLKDMQLVMAHMSFPYSAHPLKVHREGKSCACVGRSSVGQRFSLW